MKAKMPRIHQGPSRPRVSLEREGSKSVALWVTEALPKQTGPCLLVGVNSQLTTFSTSELAPEKVVQHLFPT